jgi:hypothetical protein
MRSDRGFRHRSTGWIAGVSLGVTAMAAAAGAQVVPMTMPELVREADRIVRGQVVDQRSQRVRTADGELIVTLVTVRVQRTLKGEPRLQLFLEFPGGTVGTESLELPGMAVFEPGDRAVLFLHDRGSQLSPIVGYAQGHFAIETSNTHDVVVLEDGAVLAGLDQVGRVGLPIVNAVPRPPLTVEQFETEILRLVESGPPR